jgi:hypothetical protein
MTVGDYEEGPPAAVGGQGRLERNYSGVVPPQALEGRVGRRLRFEEDGPHMGERPDQVVDRVIRHAIERANLENRKPRPGFDYPLEEAPALVAAVRNTASQPRQDARHGPGVDVAPH